MQKHRERVHHLKHNTSRRLRNNLRILLVVYLVLLIVTIYSAINSHAILWQVLVGFALGIIVGLVSSRMYKISWDEGEAKVIGRIDIYGVIVLVLFIVFELNRNNVARLFASGESLTAVGLTLITGALLGRVFGTSRQIVRIARSRK